MTKFVQPAGHGSQARQALRQWPEVWLNLHRKHDLHVAERELAEEIAKIPTSGRRARDDQAAPAFEAQALGIPPLSLAASTNKCWRSTRRATLARRTGSQARQDTYSASITTAGSPGVCSRMRDGDEAVER
jgi:hypothetical protein